MIANRTNETQVVIDRLAAYPEVKRVAKIVGTWIWIEFASKPRLEIREFLKAQGFIWNRTRGAWQHSGGHFSRHSNGDPRLKYGEQDITDRLYEDDCAARCGFGPFDAPEY